MNSNNQSDLIKQLEKLQKLVDKQNLLIQAISKVQLDAIEANEENAKALYECLLECTLKVIILYIEI
jgi:hypothetical protein